MNEILDFTVIFLLIVAIIYGFVLNRRIMIIQEGKKELANLFKSFDNTILRAQNSIEDLKIVSTEISDVLQKKIDKAAILIDDIEFLCEKSAQAANEMEKKVSAAQKKLAEVKISEPVESSLTPEKIRNMRASSIPAAPSNKDESRVKALEGLLEKISKTNEQREKNKPEKPSPKSRFSRTKQPQADNDEQLVENVLKALGYGE